MYLNDSYDIQLNASIVDFFEEPYILENVTLLSWVLNFSYFEYVEPNTLPYYNYLPNWEILEPGQTLRFSTGAASNDTTKVEVYFDPESAGDFTTYQIDKDDFKINFKVSQPSES